MWENATKQWGFMPEVCPEGKECRDGVWISLELEIKELYRSSISRMMSDLESMMYKSQQTFEAAWLAASNCPHGCELTCTEQTVVYTNTLERMSFLEQEIYQLIQDYETEVS